MSLPHADGTPQPLMSPASSGSIFPHRSKSINKANKKKDIQMQQNQINELQSLNSITDLTSSTSVDQFIPSSSDQNHNNSTNNNNNDNNNNNNNGEPIMVNGEIIDEADLALFTGDTNILKALLILSSGPFIAQVALSFYGVINMMWVARSIGDKGIASIGAVVIVEFFANSIAIYLNTCICIQVSYLEGLGKKQACCQLVVDFIRVCLIIGVLLPAIILPTAPYLIKWFEAEDDILHMAMQYLIPSQLGCTMLFVFYTVCGFLEATGHMWLYAIVQVAAFCLNMLCFNPLFLLGLRLPIWAASLSTVISESIPTIVVVFLIFRGRFNKIKPSFSMFCRGFSRETFIALRTGIADLIEAFSIDFSLILMQKFIDKAAAAAGALDAVLGVWSIIDKLEQLISCVSNGIGEGLLPLASFAHGRGDYKRLLWLMFHSLWVMSLWAGIISLALIVFPKQIATIWSHDPEFLEWAEKMIRIYAYTGVLTAVDYTIPIILMAMQKPCEASCVSVFALLIPQPICAIALYYTKKDDPARIIWTFDISDLFSLVIGGAFMVKPLLDIRKKLKKEDFSSINRKLLFNGDDDGKVNTNLNNADDYEYDNFNDDNSKNNVNQKNSLNAKNGFYMDSAPPYLGTDTTNKKLKDC